jgi:hypothetical protein
LAAFVQVSVYNTDAIAFYERLGWRTRQVLMFRNEEEGPEAEEEAEWLNGTTTTITNAKTTGEVAATLARGKL